MSRENRHTSLKEDLVATAKAIFRGGLVQTGEGNVSIRVPCKDELFITPTFNRYETMNERSVVRLRFDGSSMTKGMRASAEYRLHVEIYRARPRAQCVIHTHSPYATMFSILGREIPVLTEEMIVFIGGEIKVSEFAPAHTDELGAQAIRALGTNNAALLANHGVLVCARTPQHGVKFAELVEKAAMIYWGALNIGESRPVPAETYPKFRQLFESDFSTH